MNGMVDYLNWRGDLSMASQLPCEIDLLILSQLVYAPLEKLQMLHGENLDRLTREIYPEPPQKEQGQLYVQRYDLWCSVAKSKRFEDVRLRRFVMRSDASAQKQFAAAFFIIGLFGIVVFRGTDSTLLGWKEDFNMAFEETIPAQQEAVNFLNQQGEKCDYLYVCGHSKGGNLAMYASAMCREDVKKRILYVANFDGPGLSRKIAETPEWAGIKNRVHSFVPESSIIGMLFTTEITPVIVESDSTGIMQHSPFFWHILGSHFVCLQQTTFSSRVIDQMMDLFIKNCTYDQKKLLTDTLYQVLSLTEAKYIRDIPAGARAHCSEIISAIWKLPKEERTEFGKIILIWAEALHDSFLSNCQTDFFSNLIPSMIEKLPEKNSLQTGIQKLLTSFTDDNH